MRKVEIRERRFKLELYELNDFLDIKREGDDDPKEFAFTGKTTSTNQATGDSNSDAPSSERINQPQAEQEPEAEAKVLPPLCELVSFSARFALNDIPAATVVPATGTEILTDAEELTYEKLQELAVKNKPVGVYLTVLNSTRTFSDERDNQYWPEKCCIFKGYIQPPMLEVTAYNAGRTITIWHWLSSLANVSLLTTACYVGNPIETTLQGYGLPSALPRGTWAEVLLEGTVALDNVWKKGIKPLYLQLLDWGEDRSDKYNDFVKDQRERMRTAIDKIEQFGEVNDQLNASSHLNALIARDLRTDSMADFVQTDGWSKLISDYFPSYLLAISPQVDKATIIPVPCTVEPWIAKPIEMSEIFSVQATPFIAKKLGHITCVAATSPNNNNKPVGVPHYVGLGTYPPEKIERGGINVTIGYPDWLTQEGVGSIPDTPDQIDFLISSRKAAEQAKTKDEEVEALNKAQGTVGYQYAQVAYLTQAFNGTFVRVSMPVNMNFSPGAMVKVYKDRSGETAYYGTVASVEINMTSGNTVMTTVLTLSNIRDQISINDEVDNPVFDNVGFYKEQWSGKNEPLYAKVDD